MTVSETASSSKLFHSLSFSFQGTNKERERERCEESKLDERNSRSQTLTWSQQPGLSALEQFLDPLQLQVVLMAAGIVLDALGHLGDGAHRPCRTTNTHTNTVQMKHIPRMPCKHMDLTDT